ncbi:MAG: prephenate dehydrogenase [Vicinamibacterales bacterium]
MRRVAIVGRGLIGGSIERAARERLPGLELIVLDRGDALTAAANADLIVLSAPIGEIVGLLGALRPIVTPATLITDTGSTKAAIVSAASGLRFIGGHPIAGAAASGLAAARADLFAGRPWVLTPAAGSDPGDLERLRAFVSSLGARPYTLDAAEHDRLFAYVSHLPQLVVSALMDVVGTAVGAEGLALAGSGLRDSTRLASSPPAIWRDIASTNQAHIGPAIDALIEALETLRSDNAASLTATFERAARWRAALEGAEPRGVSSI